MDCPISSCLGIDPSHSIAYGRLPLKAHVIGIDSNDAPTYKVFEALHPIGVAMSLLRLSIDHSWGLRPSANPGNVL